MHFSSVVSAAGALLLAACGPEVLHIESDTTWEGMVVSDPVSGRGTRDITLPSKSQHPAPICWDVAKTTEAGTLRVWIENPTWFGLGNDIRSDETTTEAFGAVEGCAQ